MIYKDLKDSYHGNGRRGSSRNISGGLAVNIVTYMPIARQRLGKHIPEAYALNNRASIAR
jgi:hypothetical protein